MAKESGDREATGAAGEVPVGENVRKFREAAGLTVQQFAERTGFSAALQQAETEMRMKAGCIFPAQVSAGRCVPVFKVLMSDACHYDCGYCATRADRHHDLEGRL